MHYVLDLYDTGGEDAGFMVTAPERYRSEELASQAGQRWEDEPHHWRCATAVRRVDPAADKRCFTELLIADGKHPAVAESHAIALVSANYDPQRLGELYLLKDPMKARLYVRAGLEAARRQKKRTSLRLVRNPRAHHAAGFSMEYSFVSPQKARSLLTKFHGKRRALPRPGHEIRLDDDAVLVNRAGDYEVHIR